MAVTVQQEVAALYSAIFNRAPDQEGLNNWVNLIQGGASLSQAADGFVQHPVFTELYAGLTNIQFVQQLYINVLGSEGDAKGIQNWANLLASGVSKAQVVADFVQGALSVDLNAMLASGELTQAEFDAAVIRQDTLTNKANVGVYFAETFGAASNLDPATDTSTVAGLQADPAYLASQAAIANVTADAATVTAAQGRIDVAVATNDPAGNLVGANSELTAALVDLQAKQGAVTDALEALALSDETVTLDASGVPLTGAALESAVGTYVTAGQASAQGTLTAAAGEVATAQSGLASAQTALQGARALATDAQLDTAVVNATSAVNANPAVKQLYTNVNNANTAVQNHLASAGTDRALLEGLRNELTAFVNAGNPSTTELVVGGATVADLLDLITAELADETNEAEDFATLVATYADTYAVTPKTAGAPTAAETALQNAIDKVDVRADLYEKVDTAESAFIAQPLGKALRDAEEDVVERNEAIQKVEDARTELTEAQENLATVTALFEAYETAVVNAAAALDVVEALGYTVETDLTAGDSTVQELFVASLTAADAATDYELTDFSGDDVLFIGTGYQFGGAVSATLTEEQLFAQGNANALEVFFTLDAVSGDVVANIETKAFASNASEYDKDIVSITLTGVQSVDEVVFSNGFVSIA